MIRRRLVFELSLALLDLRNFGENGLPFSFSSSDPRPSLTPSAEQYALFQSRSPISRVGDVKAATLILMGEEDRRVPPTQTKVRLLPSLSSLSSFFPFPLFPFSISSFLTQFWLRIARLGTTPSKGNPTGFESKTPCFPRESRGKKSFKSNVSSFPAKGTPWTESKLRSLGLRLVSSGSGSLRSSQRRKREEGGHRSITR